MAHRFSTTESLPSIHFEREQFEEFISLLMDHTESPELLIKAKYGKKTHSFESLEEFFTRSEIPDMIGSFSLIVRGKEGYVLISADNKSDKHYIKTEGDLLWAQGLRTTIDDFFETRKNKFRNYLSGRRKLFLELFLIGAFLGPLAPYIVAYLNPITHVPVPMSALAISGATLLLLAFTMSLNRLYPFIVLKRQETQLLSRLVLVKIAGVISVVAGLITIANALL